MQNLLILIQIIISVILIVLILVQSRGTGLGRTFGGGRGTSFTRRGLEKVIFKLTFLLSALFFIVSFLAIAF